MKRYRSIIIIIIIIIIITKQQTMRTSEYTTRYGWSWSEERGYAGIFSLFGLGCSHAPTPRRLSKSVHGEEDPAVRSAILVWTEISQSTIPANALKHVQKA